MKTIEIKIPELGKAVGTTAWIAEKIEHIQKTLKTGKTRGGEPCLTYEHWDDKDKDGKPKRYVLCFISPFNPEHYFYQNRIGDVFCIKPVQEDYDSSYIFPVLSQKAKEIVDEFLDALCQKFWEEYNEN